MKEISLYNDFPRDVGKFRKVIETAQELSDYINNNNGIKDCYISVYKFTKKIDGRADYESAVIDKIFLDFDNKHGYECFCIMRDFLLPKGYIFRVHLSARDSRYFNKNDIDPKACGFHFYIFLEEGSIQDKIELRMLHDAINKMIEKELKNKYNIIVSKTGKDDKELPDNQIREIIDPHIMGDIARISRIVNTFNIARNRFCVPLSKEDLFKDAKELFKLTASQRLEGDFWIGNKLMKINRSMFNDTIKAKFKQEYNGSLEFVKTSYQKMKEARQFFPPCINAILDRNEQGINLYHDERLLLASFLLKIGLTVNDIVDIFSKQPDFSASITEYQARQIELEEYMPASCVKLLKDKLCKKSEDKYRHPLCFRDKPVKNPLNFYKQLSKWLEES